ncbi:MAG: hypothetical protein IJL69_05375 [Oscillospiraceae bacterium]|nr:hypothetical protein [Oscillospiraceae bacterium]
MKDTIRFARRNAVMIAHRGLSGIETENTAAAFVAAGNRSYGGIETDVHRTADGQFVVIHDDRTGRVSDADLPVEETEFAVLRQLTLHRPGETASRWDLRIPTLDEYLALCRTYGKLAVLELKNRFSPEDVGRICARAGASGWLEHVIFISFCLENLTDLRRLLPDQPVQFLTGEGNEALLDRLQALGFGLDLHYPALTEELAAACRRRGIPLNVWTVDDPADAERLDRWGVDFITSNILE